MKTALLFALVLLAMLFTLSLLKKRRKAFDAQYYKKKPLSRVEQVLYYRLVKALPKHVVLCQVSLYQLLGIKRGAASQSAFNQMSRKCADFVICTPSFDVLAIIELDDYSHHNAKRMKADAQKEFALEKAGIRLIRWWSNDLPSVETIGSIVNTQPTVPAASIDNAK